MLLSTPLLDHSPTADAMLTLAIVLALVWGVAWAIVLQFTRRGRYLAARRTWITVVVGVGVDLLILLLVVPWEWWWRVFAIIVASSLGIIGRSLNNEFADDQENINAAKAETTDQRH